jgi:hypothetical protein
LQLGDKLIALLHNVYILLVFVVWAVRLNDALYAINGARYAVSGNEFGEIPKYISMRNVGE